MKPRVVFAVLTSAFLALAGSSFAALLGVRVAFPLITYQNTGDNALSYNATLQLFSIDVVTIEVIAICVFISDVISLVFAAGGGARVCPQREEAETCADHSSSCARSGWQPGISSGEDEPDLDGF